MSEEALRLIQPQLDALPPEAVVEPTLPIAVFCQQGERLVQLIVRDRAVLLQAGVEVRDLDELPHYLSGLRTADAIWQTSRRQGRPEDQIQREAQGFQLRDDAIATARWGLRRDPEVPAILAAIIENEGLADMLDDLEKLAALYRRKADSFLIPDFDPLAQAEQLEQQAALIRAGSAAWRIDEAQSVLKQRRDRAFTLAKLAIDEIRDGARYVFRKDEAKLQPYRDQHLLEQSRRSRARKKQAGATEPAPA